MFFTEYNLSNPGDFTCCIAVPPESRGEHLVTLPRQKALCIFYHGAKSYIIDIRIPISMLPAPSKDIKNEVSYTA